LILPQKVKVKWNGRTREHYEKLGYVYTKKDEEFEVSAHELTPGSNIKISVMCDYCKKTFERRNDLVVESRKTIDKDCCTDCSTKKHYEALLKIRGSVESKFPELVKEWCPINNRDTPDKTTPSSKKIIEWVCDKGHRWRAPVYSRTGKLLTGCPTCNESMGEKRITEILDALEVNYEKEVSIDKLKGVGGGLLRFDFAIKDSEHNVRALIEYDGEFHFGEVFEGDRSKITAVHDKLKNKYCEENGIKLYRIHYKEYDNLSNIITNICKKELETGEEALAGFNF